jgi:23S rRNA (adenine2503-C2)-methyltransferase
MDHLLNITPAELADRLVALGEKSFRAGQIIQWIWQRSVVDFAEMTNLSKTLRAELPEHLAILAAEVAARRDSDDGVVKLLLSWPDGQQVECVLIPASGRVTACVSTQAGCAMGCAFCASGIGGLGRDLTAGEIVEQVLQLQHVTGQAVTNVVLMGMGEPLANYDATVQAVRVLTDSDRGGLSARKITVSTCGLPGPIRRLAEEDLPITLAISLHAPNDTLRRELMPAAARYPIDKILAAAEVFYASRHREVTIEYLLLGGVNDNLACADALADRLRPLRCNVNLIGYNPVAGLDFARPSDQAVAAFRARLEKRGINVHLRHSRGIDAQAACGQLRHPSAT